MKKQKINTDILSAVDVYKLVLNRKLRTFPAYFWEKPYSLEESAEITKYLIKNILKWNDNDIKKKLSVKIFSNNKLNGMLKAVFSSSPFKAINNAYPDKFKEWEMPYVTRGFWTLENGVIATKWLIEDKLKWSDEDIKSKLCKKTFVQNGLEGMIGVLYNNSHIQAIDSAYLNKFKPWEFLMSPLKFWNKQTAIQATLWMFNEKLHWNIEDIKSKFNKQIVIDNGLNGMLVTVYNSSLYLMLKDAYPNEDWNYMVSRYK